MELWRDAAALMVVFGLLGYAVFLLRKRNGQAGFFRPGAARVLSSVERVALTPQHALHLVRASGREFVLVTHPHGCTMISEMQANQDMRATAALHREEHA